MTDVLVTASCRPGGWARAEGSRGLSPGKAGSQDVCGVSLRGWRFNTGN